MIWLLTGIVSPFLWSINNAVDQLLMRQDFKGQGLPYLGVASILAILIAAPIMAYDRAFFDITLMDNMLFFIMAVLGLFAFWPYMVALEKDEASHVVPFFQTIPVFVFVFSYIGMGETITSQQLIGSALIMGAAFLIMFDWHTFRFRLQPIMLMLAASFMLGVATVIQRYTMQEIAWYTVFGWICLHSFFLGLGFLLCHRGSRRLAHTIFLSGNLRLLTLVTMQEVISFAAFMLFTISLAYAPAAGLTQTLNGFQPFFVLVVGWAAYCWMPLIFAKPDFGRIFIWHIGCLAAMLMGVGMIYHG